VAPSLLSDTVTDGNLAGLLSLYSLSKQSHLAGYRAAMLAGSADLIQSIVLPRRHLGLMVPEPIQQVMASALQRADHVESVRGLYQRRRALLAPAIERAGWRIEGGDAGLYLWITRDTSSSEAVSWFAERGILVAPGHFYGQGGHRHVRVALTATTENIEAAAVRILANN
jgi:aspartate/methionine/tyrosine aminotransferase